MSDSLVIGPYTVGEKPSPLAYTFLDSGGSRMNLSGYTAEFHYRRSDSAVATVGAAVVSDPVNGVVTHVWTGAEFSTPGTWWSEIWVGNGVQRYASKRFEAVVRAQIGAVPAI